MPEQKKPIHVNAPEKSGRSDTGLPGHHGAVWRRAGILALVCVALAAAASSADLHAALISLLETSREIIARNPVAGAALFVMFAAVSAMLAFVSIAVIVPVAVYAWGEPLSMLLLWVGWVLGGAVTYFIGRYLGRAVVNWLTTGAALSRLEQRVNRDTPFALVLLFQLALPSEIPGYVLGLARYSFAKYVLALGIVEVPYTIATIVLGASFVERRGGMILGFGLGVAVLSVGAFYLLRKKLTGATP